MPSADDFPPAIHTIVGVVVLALFGSALLYALLPVLVLVGIPALFVYLCLEGLA